MTKLIPELLIETSYCQAFSCTNANIGKYDEINLEPPKFTRWPHEKIPSDGEIFSILDQLFQKPFENYLICFVIVQMGLISSQLIAIVVLSSLLM
jgi:hypothetical protein